jgi:hypothetical protein
MSDPVGPQFDSRPDPWHPRFCWTEKGKRVHITDDGARTRCGWPVTEETGADNVVWFWPPCGKCVGREDA